MDWVKAVPWVVAVIFGLAAASATHMYLNERDEFTAYRSKAEQQAADDEAAVKEAKDRGEKNLQQLKDDYETKLPAVRSGAVNAYCLRHPTLCRPAACADAASQPVDDGAEQKPVACEREFIRTAAEVAAKLGAFQDYCKRNNCPVKD